MRRLVDRDVEQRLVVQCRVDLDPRVERNGPIGTVDLTFLGQYTRFENYANIGGGSARF